jgi:hypothetical protein
MIPQWKDLYELYLDTRDPRHLKAAHQGARRFAQFVWFYPAIPHGDITVNESGFAPKRGSLTQHGLLPVPKETVPTWRVSEQGLVCEGNGTVQRLGILLATHAPWFLRIAHDTNDAFLRDIARSALIGRFANFPGYHTNTLYSTAQEKADFPMHPHEELKPTTSFHFNHVLPMANLVLDYLISDAYSQSKGAIDFPGEFAESYAFLGGRIYGGAPGKFHDVADAQPWMPHGLVRIDDVQVNYVAARSGNKLCLAFMNQCGRALPDISFQLNPAHFAKIPATLQAQAWHDNQLHRDKLPVSQGAGRISLSAKGITALVIEGLEPKVAFQSQLHQSNVAPQQSTFQTITTSLGEARAIVLSFGPRQRWLYAYLTGDATAAHSAKLHIKTASRETALTDASFPFEFSLPLQQDDGSLTLTFEGKDAAGRAHPPASVTLLAAP